MQRMWNGTQYEELQRFQQRALLRSVSSIFLFSLRKKKEKKKLKEKVEKLPDLNSVINYSGTDVFSYT